MSSTSGSSSGEGRGRVPIRMNDFSVVDAEFGNIRERFDSEMKKMEDEMNKFRSVKSLNVDIVLKIFMKFCF